MLELLGVEVNDGDVVVDGERRARRYAAAHMLADAWAVLVALPRVQADHMRSLLMGLGMLKG